MTTYIAHGMLAYTTTYHLRCPYCQKVYAASDVHQEFFKEQSALADTPLQERVIQKAEARFGKKQQTLRAAIAAGKYVNAPRECICPGCGFVPAFLIPKGRYRAIQIGAAVIGTILAGSLLALAMSGDESAGYACAGSSFLPFLILIGIMEVQMRPNRKLIRKARAEGRTLDLNVKPELVFSPIRAGELFQPPH